MGLWANKSKNLMIRRGCLVAEVAVIILYEHVSRSFQIGLIAVASLAGGLAAVAYLCSKQSSAEDGSLETNVQSHVPSRIQVRSVQIEYLSYLDLIKVPDVYKEQWSAVLYHATGMHPVGTSHYSKSVSLGSSADWKSSELSEIMKAVTAANRRFTVELTNSDSLLIHCDPVASDQSAVEHNEKAIEGPPIYAIN